MIACHLLPVALGSPVTWSNVRVLPAAVTPRAMRHAITETGVYL